MKRIIGILGGMGPEATAYFYELIIKKTQAEKDQEHIKVVIYSDPEIPPRTDAILGEGPSPAPLLLEGVRRLMKAGADFIVMPCVTAHHFMPEVVAQDRFEFLSLVDESLRWTREYIPSVKTVGIVASTGTLKSRLFHDTFKKAGIDVIGPEEAEQDMVMAAIFGKEGIKAGFIEGRPKEVIVDIAKALIGDRNIDIQFTGIRPGEKMHEILISEEEANHCLKRSDYYAIQPMLPELGEECNDEPGSLIKEFSSVDNVLHFEETVKLLQQHQLMVEDSYAEG